MLIILLRQRSPSILAPAGAAAFLGPLGWSALRRAATDSDSSSSTSRSRRSHISWQDAGSGVFTLTTGSVLLGLALHRQTPSRASPLSATAAFVALLVDFYLYWACDEDPCRILNVFGI